MKRMITVAGAVALAVGTAVLGAAPAQAAPPLGSPVPVSRSALINAGYTCTASVCTKPGAATFYCTSATSCLPATR